MSILIWIILACLVNGLVAFSGALTLLFSHKFVQKLLLVLVAFSAGALLSGAFFHLIPESLETIAADLTFWLVLTGFVLFVLMEKFLFWHHCHENHCDVHPVSYLILWGDGLHNFIDGLIIAASFIVSIPFGITTTLLILIHEFPQELGDFGVLIYGGFGKGKALLFNFISQMACLIGGILGFVFAGASGFSAYLVPVAAGGFIYIAASDLIPEIMKEKSMKKSLLYLLAFIIGILMLFLFRVLFGR